MNEHFIKVIADAPSKVDLLGNSSYANALFRIIRSETTYTPLNIGVLGEWGTGKSTLMMQLATRLSAEGFPVVIFNPWKYDGKEEIVHALIQTILITFDKQESSKETRELITGISKGLGQMVLSKLISAATFDTVNFDKIVDIYSEKKEENIKFINEFESAFTELVSKYSGDKKLVIFIDDLDRCLPDNIIKVLESIKLFLSVPKCIFVIGIDNVVIQEAISEKYGKHYNFSGKDYLEKIIQLSFTIPNASQKNIEEFTKKMCNGQSDKNTIRLIVSGCRSNPRRIKRFINASNLITAVMEEEISLGTRPTELNKNLLSFILLLQIQFSAAYNYYLNNIKDCVDLLKMLNEKRYFEKEQIDKIKTFNPSYSLILENKDFIDFIKKASVLEITFDLGDEGLSEYFSATKTISLDNETIDSYYTQETVKGKFVRFSTPSDLYLLDGGPNKLNVVKVIKDLTGLGLKESKDKVDGAPKLILEDVPREKLPVYKKLLEDAGATVEYR